MQLLPDNLNIDFVGKRTFFAVLSGVVIVTSVLLFFVVGPKWGIDFTGGTEIFFQFDQPLSIAEVRSAIETVGLQADSVQQEGSADKNEFMVRIQDTTFGMEEARSEVEQALRASFGDDWIREVRFSAEVGARMTVVYKGEDVPAEKIMAALAPVTGAQYQDTSDENTFYVKLPAMSSKVEKAISTAVGGKEFKVLSVESVGPKVGKELRTQGFVSIGLTLLLITAYVAFRFDMAYAPGAIIALFHDITLTVGVFVVLRRDFDMSIIGVLLTILGYSINDTIVIYDRIRENMKKYRRKDLSRLINDTINEMLGRTIATTFTVFLAVLPFLFLGQGSIENFALAMLVGIITGCYSTIYIASPIMIILEGVKPKVEKFLVSARRKTAEEAAGVAGGARRMSPEDYMKAQKDREEDE
jgi:preprotein translocase subunit SecF